MKDSLGDEMKWAERRCQGLQFSQYEHIYCRVDGRAFHSWVKKMGFTHADPRMIHAMAWATNNTAILLGCDIAYAQSDEVSFGWFAKKGERSQHIFNGKISKINSIVPSTYTSQFIMFMMEAMYKHTGKAWFPKAEGLPTFDCRTVGFDQQEDFQKMFYWRYLDAKRNAINSFAQTRYSHKSLQGKNLAAVIQQLKDDGHYVDFEALPEDYREGIFFGSPKYTDRLGEAISSMTNKEIFIDVFRQERENG